MGRFGTGFIGLVSVVSLHSYLRLTYGDPSNNGISTDYVVGSLNDKIVNVKLCTYTIPFCKNPPLEESSTTLSYLPWTVLKFCVNLPCRILIPRTFTVPEKSHLSMPSSFSIRWVTFFCPCSILVHSVSPALGFSVICVFLYKVEWSILPLRFIVLIRH